MYSDTQRGNSSVGSETAADERWSLAEVRHLERDMWLRSVLVFVAVVLPSAVLPVALVTRAPLAAYPAICIPVGLVLLYLRCAPAIAAARLARIVSQDAAMSPARPGSAGPERNVRQSGGRYARAMPRPSAPDLSSLRAVLLELAGYDSLRVTISLQHGGRTDELRGSPVQLLSRIEEYVEGVEVVRFEF